MESVFENVSIKNEKIDSLQGISGSVKTGEILAVCSHSASTNTLLLSALAGRRPADTGQIEIKGPGNQTRLDCVAFVDQRDLFLPTLSVGETLEYAAELRLGPRISRKRRSLIKDVLHLSGLHDVRKTQVLVASQKYKKLLSIACELVREEIGVLIVDEPMFGLCLADALDVISTLAVIATSRRLAMIISATNQNSSWLSVCHNVMFLSPHQMLYHGKLESLTEFLLIVGSPCPPYMSPSDYMMELSLKREKQDEDLQTKMIQLSKSTLEHSHSVWIRTKSTPDGKIFDENLGVRVVTKTATPKDESSVAVEAETLLVHHGAKTQTSLTSKSSLWQQSCILTRRNFHNARRRILFPVSIIQNLYILVLCVLVWWRPERTEQSVTDRMGLFFFTTVQWAFFSLLDAILTFPKELKVYSLERSSKLYHVTALCIGKSLSELPLALVQPFAYMSVIYWVANLNSVHAFLWSLLVLTFDVYAAQSVGLFVGVALKPPWTISVVSLGLLSMMLWGGAFNKLPSFLSWGPYASFFTYGLRALVTLEFQNGPPIRCANNSMVPICNTLDPLTNTTVTHFPSEMILGAQGLVWPVWYYIAVLGGIIVVMRCLWYFLLRMK